MMRGLGESSRGHETAAEDRVLRALTDDGAFRVVTVNTTSTVRSAIAAQRTSGEAARVFADLVTGAILVRETMAPDLRLQAILQGEKTGDRMIADAHPEGMTRGLVHLPQGVATFSFGGSARMQIARSLHNGALHQGVVAAAADGGISGALMGYMQSSEQVVSTVAVGTHVKDGSILAAGGYMVQLLPEVADGPLAVMTERLQAFESIEKLLAEGHASPKELLSEILYGMPHTEVGHSPVFFGCNCSTERILASLATLPRHEVRDLYARGEVLEIACDYCRKEYRITPELLRGLVGEKN
jgi:molecular chaperone Hsp33